MTNGTGPVISSSDLNDTALNGNSSTVGNETGGAVALSAIGINAAALMLPLAFALGAAVLGSGALLA
jgi:hypothetical protein